MTTTTSTRRAFALLACIACASCRVFGLQPALCVPGDPTTCPAGEACAADGTCGAGAPGDAGQQGGADAGVDAGAAVAVETLAADEALAALLARDDDGALFWATGVADGCVRRLGPDDAAPATVTCLTGGGIVAALALSNDHVIWLEERAGTPDVLALLTQGSDTTDTPFTLSRAATDGGTPSLDRGPNLIAARSIGNDLAVAWAPDPTDPSMGVERIYRSNGITTSTAEYQTFFGDGIAGVALTDSDLFFTLSGDVYARVVVRDGHAGDDTGSYGAYTDDGANVTFPAGGGWASAVLADAMYVSTRDASDQGGILRSRGAFAGGFVVVEVIVAEVDPESRGRYARGLAVDGDALYYTTGGIGASAPGVFRLSLSEGAVPTRIATLAVEGGSVAVDDEWIYWTEPEANAVRRIAKP